jgi:hypothetical protein
MRISGVQPASSGLGERHLRRKAVGTAGRRREQLQLAAGLAHDGLRDGEAGVARSRIREDFFPGFA